MRLWWSARSPYVRKVMLALHELGLAERVEILPVTVTERTPHLNPALAAENPAVTIPTLVFPDGTALSESTLICLELDRQFAPGVLVPAGQEARVLARTALASQLTDALMKLRLYAGIKAEGMDLRIAGCEWKRAGLLAWFERDMQGVRRKRPDLGDLGLCSALAYLDFRFAEQDWRGAYPGLAEWMSGMAARPSFAATEHADA
ncbi:MAG: glutathione S-transferase [Rhodobacteraceae bacterium]|jgi:glutathione S-transferase|nr:glutathione S-transferase [Paracoccaceae bacterium]